MAFWKESMINRLSNLINRNRSAAKISQVLCSSIYVEDITLLHKLGSTKDKQILPDSNRCLFSPPSFQL